MTEPSNQLFDVLVECDDRKFSVFVEALTLAEAANFAALAVNRRIDKPATVLRAKLHDAPVAVLVHHVREPLHVLEFGRQRRVPCFVGLRVTDDPKQPTFDDYLRKAEGSRA